MEQRLTDEQERMRIEGLRILARIIARHALAQPNLYKDRATAEHQPPVEGNRKDGG